jgi:hypothetical protein
MVYKTELRRGCMMKQFIFVILVSFCLQMGTVLYASDQAVNEQLIQGSWYCSCSPDKDVESCSRFDFKSNGTLMKFSRNQSKNKKINYWTSYYDKPVPNPFQSPTEIEVKTWEDGKLLIVSLTADELSFKWVTSSGKTFYSCSRTRPEGDTDENRSKAEAWIKSWDNFYYGKWWSKDRKAFLEFFRDGTSTIGFLEKNGQWRTHKEPFHGDDEGARCCIGGDCAFERGSANTIVSIGNHGQEVETFFREKVKK